MKSYTTLRNLYGTFTKNTASANLTLGDQLINDSYRRIISFTDWPFLAITRNLTTIAGTQAYNLPYDTGQVRSVSVTVGSYKYVPREVISREEWDRINQVTVSSDMPTRFFIYNNQLLLFPTPVANRLAYDAQTGNFTVGLTLTGGTSGATATITADQDSGTTGTLTLSSIVGVFQDNEIITDSSTGSATANGGTGNTITVNSKRNVKDLSIADYTTGTIVSVANGGTAVVGTGTSWTTKMAGRYIRITDSDVANAGDGYWYEIASVGSATTLTLSRAYGGATISAATVAYTIGQMPLLPENYEVLPVYEATSVYWGLNPDKNNRQKFYGDKFKEGLVELKKVFSSVTTNVVLDDGVTWNPANPNLTVTL